MARGQNPHYVDTVILGGGPSSLILSYILHGHVPYYSEPHPDALLDAKLSKEPNLLKITPHAYAHFYSSLRYSTQALPLNTLLDTLIRPNADTEVNPQSCVEWKHEPGLAVSHVVLTNTGRAGGQWAENPVTASWDIGTLSYSEMLSLPGYSYAEHYLDCNGTSLPDLQRPSRTDVANYYAAYPGAVGISDTLYTHAYASHVSREDGGFIIGSHNIHCKHLVLATGIFSLNIAPPPLLSPIMTLNDPHEPLLVIGSGFSAADVIISVPPARKILHIFRWSPDNRPSPLRGCHHQAYPEYAGIYRQMKLAAMNSSNSSHAMSPMKRRKSTSYFSHRDWTRVYEGLPNAEIQDVKIEGRKSKLRIRLESGEMVEREVGALAYVVGRRGKLNFLTSSLCQEVLGNQEGTKHSFSSNNLISGRTLRPKVETSFEVAPDVFVIGSLTGDSLVRHAFGGCVYAASKIMGANEQNTASNRSDATTIRENGVDGNRERTIATRPHQPTIQSNGVTHQDLHINWRRASR